MSKSPAPATLKLTGRSALQVQSVERYLPAWVASATASTITFKPGLTWAELASLVAAAITDAKAQGLKGHSITLHSVQRAVAKAQEAEPTAAVDRKSARSAEAALARNRAANRKAAAKKVPARKAAPRKPAAGTQARLAKALKADASKATAVPGYALKWPHGGYDLYRATDKAAASAPAWLVRCTAHGTTTPAANAKAGDALGTAKARVAWCKGCAKVAKAGPPAAKARKLASVTPIKGRRTTGRKAQPRKAVK